MEKVIQIQGIFRENPIFVNANYGCKTSKF